MTPEAERAVEEVAAARAKLDAHYKQAQATTRQLNQELRKKATTAINAYGASKYAVARAARRSRTTIYQWLKAGESSRVQEWVVADSVVADSVVRREAGESSRVQEWVVADSFVRVSADKVKQEKFVAYAMALAERFDDPSMEHWEKRELVETTARDLGVQVREMTRAVTLALKVKRGRWTSGDTR
ncbi:MAG: hypothetical protein OXG40_14510 [Acidimicrobiaceae bacterium]|nr:hypothetical protein [Acidimicrobiaceae bacterium]MDE0515128.1 hypothetical protein [Acidimicrobiaceae bacterium]